jgi:hypothetical protein
MTGFGRTGVLVVAMKPGARRRRVGAVAAMLTLGLLGSPASAQAQGSPPREVSIAISPLHLLQPFLHVTGELRLDDKIGAAAILGAGRVSEEDKRYGAWEAGGQFRYYVSGSFNRGTNLGAEVAYLHVAGRLEAPMAYYAGLRVGAFVGYKIATTRGFTFDAQLGNQYVMPDDGDAEWQPIMNLTVGWSF